MPRARQFNSGAQRAGVTSARLLVGAIRRLAHVPGPGRWSRYGVAALAAALATGLRWGLGQLVGETLSPFITYYPMVMFTALLGGAGPGLVGTVIASVAIAYFFLAPSGSFAVAEPADRIALLLFVLVNIAVSLVAGALRSARQRTFVEARRAEASEERFLLFMNHTPTLAWIKDDRGRYTYINKAYEERFGHTLAECRGKTDADLWPPEVAMRLQEADRAVLASGRPMELTEETTEQDGTASFWLNTKFPIRDAAGGQFVASIGLDITDRKRFQEAMEQSEARLRLAVETAELGMYERDLVTNKISLNAACQAILGATEPYPPDLANRSLHPEDRQRVLAEVARAFDPALRAICSAEFRIFRPDGSIRWVAGRGRVLFDEDVSPPRPVRFIGVLNDITERKNYEDSLVRSGARLSQAIRVARLGTFEHNHQTDLIEFSPELRNMYGFAPTEKVTVPGILQRVPSQQRGELAAAIERAHDPAGEGLFEMEHCVLAPEREARWLSVRSQTFFSGQGPERRAVRTIGAILDITEQKDHAAALTRLVHERTAKLQETVAELEHFSYTITHDMRAPLRAISGYAGVLVSSEAHLLTDQGRDLLRRISASALRMDQLITDSLQYNRALRERFQLEPLEPAAIIRGLIESYPSFQAPHAQITVQPEMPHVLANEAALIQVFSNLLGNAVKFITPGQVPEIAVTAERRGGFVRLCVSDNGIGIPPQYHEKIWQMFQRLSKGYEGTGIGLALVRKVVERMGGKVGLESAPGQGSRFWIELRRAAERDNGPGTLYRG